ncbi:MAG: tRNA (guanosine(37)-N1)-methyltransferase TrmD [bacterium]|nr:tRNA (guanosine(37)-N1)-methyltransferase TrmD [bacterium]
MKFKIITLFPDFFESPLKSGLLGKAIDSGIIEVELVDLRAYSEDKFRRCDDYPYGGGSGMVLTPEPLFKALEAVKEEKTRVILTTPGGSALTQKFVKELKGEEELCFICGHYEGVDQRVVDKFVDYEVSIGDYILSGGEFAALVVLDAVSRYVPGFMSNYESLLEESFEGYLLEYPHFTRPADFRGMKVPDILLSGHHKKISEWRLQKRIEKTSRVRPDLYRKYLLRKLRGE